MPELKIKADLDTQAVRQKSRSMLADLQQDVAAFKGKQKNEAGGLFELERENKVKGHFGKLAGELSEAQSAGEASAAVFSTLAEIFKTGLGIGVAVLFTKKLYDSIKETTAAAVEMNEKVGHGVGDYPETLAEATARVKEMQTALAEVNKQELGKLPKFILWAQETLPLGSSAFAKWAGALKDSIENTKSLAEQNLRDAEANQKRNAAVEERKKLEDSLAEAQERNLAAAEARLPLEQQIAAVTARMEVARVGMLTTNADDIEHTKAQLEYETQVGRLAELTAKSKSEQAAAADRAASAAKRDADETARAADEAARRADEADRMEAAADAQRQADNEALDAARDRVALLNLEIQGRTDEAEAIRIRLDYEKQIQEARAKGEESTAQTLERERDLTLQLRQQTAARERSVEAERTRKQLEDSLQSIGERIRAASGGRARGGFFRRNEDGSLTGSTGINQQADINNLSKDRRTRAERARDELTLKQAGAAAGVQGWAPKDVAAAVKYLANISDNAGNVMLRRRN